MVIVGFFAWLDIRNVFGSEPHGTISSTLTHIGVPLDLRTVIMSDYAGVVVDLQNRLPSRLMSNKAVRSAQYCSICVSN